MSNALLIDATSVFAFQQYLKQQDYPVQGNINYGALLDALRRPNVTRVGQSAVFNGIHKMKGIRINELAKELGVESHAILAKLRDEGIPDAPTNHQARIPLGLAASVREWFEHMSGFTVDAIQRIRPRPVSESPMRPAWNPAPLASNTSSSSPFERMFAFVAINPEHEGQQKFCAFLRGQGFTVDETDFRDAFIVPNRENPYQRLSTRLTYVAGMLAAPYDSSGEQRQLPHLLVVTDAFDVYYPLLDYVQNRNGQVTIAFFKRGMEERWQRAGLFDEDSPIKFRDLSNDAKSIIGADLGTSIGTKEGGKGLADFKL